MIHTTARTNVAESLSTGRTFRTAILNHVLEEPIPKMKKEFTNYFNEWFAALHFRVQLCTYWPSDLIWQAFVIGVHLGSSIVVSTIPVEGLALATTISSGETDSCYRTFKTSSSFSPHFIPWKAKPHSRDRRSLDSLKTWELPFCGYPIQSQDFSPCAKAMFLDTNHCLVKY